MESLGDYTYIIMIAVAVISGILKSIKKKQEVVDFPYPDQNEDEEYVEVYEEEFPNDINTTAQPLLLEDKTTSENVNYQTTFTSLEGMSNYDNTKDTSKLRAKKADNKQKLNSKASQKQIETEIQKPIFDINNQDEIRAAFIASEIFNRKY